LSIHWYERLELHGIYYGNVCIFQIEMNVMSQYGLIPSVIGKLRACIIMVSIAIPGEPQRYQGKWGRNVSLKFIRFSGYCEQH